MTNEPIQVLLVEDNADAALMMRDVLEVGRFGSFSVTHASRLDEAVILVAQHPFDVVLLDLDLPDSRGLKTLQRMQSKVHEVAVVVLTGLDDEGSATRALQQGAQDYLIKTEATGAMIARTIRCAIERKHAEESFHASEQQLALAVDAAQLGIWDWNVITGHVTWSPQQLMLFGLSPEQFDGRYSTFEGCLHPDDRSAVNERINNALASGQSFSHEYRVVWPDKSIRWIEDRGRVFHDARGHPARMVGTAMDITRRKVAEAEARTRLAELARLSRVSTLGFLASGLSHELNQPLAAILNYAGACVQKLESKEDSTETVLTAMNEVMNETRRAGAIISRMRAFVRKQQAHTVPIDLNDLVVESVGLLDFELRQQGTCPQLRLAEALPKVLVDAVQIKQVVVNLIYNALQAMAEPKSARRELLIELHARDHDRTVEVRVQDNGHGVAPENMERLFEPFFTTKSEGLGMGLNISRSIIESHGGRLIATANPKGGMRFTFALPVKEGAAA